jgi:hypothetical protein
MKQRRDGRLIGALCFLLLAAQAMSNEFYVSPRGDDHSVGTKGKPFKTITNARDVARKAKKPVTVFLRGLTVWTSNNQEDWVEIWRADPYHIAMGRDWLVNPYEVLPARFLKVGLRPKSTLPFKSDDERMNMRGYALRLNRIRIFTE